MNVLEILEEYHIKRDTKDFALLFDQYMHEIGARKLDRRRKDTSNTNVIEGDSANWNRVDCTYYKNSGDHMQYGKFAFCITFRKRRGDYLLIEVGSPSGEIKRPYEISYGEIVHYNKELMDKLVKEHHKLFELMRIN